MSGLSIPIVFAALVWLRFKAKNGEQLRRSVLEAALLQAGITILVTECIGLAHCLNPAWIQLAWVVAACIAIVYIWRELRVPSSTRNAFGRYSNAFLPSTLFRFWNLWEIIVVVVVLALTGLVAWLYPPTNYDSMTYQLPRMMHWFHQGTLEHYPTSNIRQLAYGPGAVYWQIQLWSLFDGDRAANLPQWIALVGYGIALTLIIQRLANREAIAMCLITGITLPMALLQASSTQADLQVGCCLAVAMVFLIDRSHSVFSSACFAGIAIGIAVVTKPSALLCFLPITIWIFWDMIRQINVTQAIKVALIWIAISLTICSAHFSRNYRWFGKPLGSDYGTVVDSFSPTLAVANAARWITLDIPLMSAWWGVANTLESCGIDPNHPAITFSDYKFSPPSRYVVYRLLLPDEDFAAYTPSLLLILLLWLATRAKRRTVQEFFSAQSLSITPLLTAIIAGLVLHIVILKWQFWGNRLLLPIMLLACPLLVAKTGAWKNKNLRTLAGGFLLLQTLFVICLSLNRPLITLPPTWRYTGAAPLFSASRTELFNAGYNSEAFPIAQRLVTVVRQQKWKNVGIVVDDDYPEYVLWRALHEAGLDVVSLHHISAKPSSNYRNPWPPHVDGEIRASTLVGP